LCQALLALLFFLSQAEFCEHAAFVLEGDSQRGIKLERLLKGYQGRLMPSECVEQKPFDLIGPTGEYQIEDEPFSRCKKQIPERE